MAETAAPHTRRFTETPRDARRPKCMIAAACLVLLALWEDQVLTETPEWKAYQVRLADAYAIEVRWTNGPLERDEATKQNTRPFRLLTMKPDYVLLEEPGVRRLVWNGNGGIDLDLKARTFTRLGDRPDFHPAHWLGLPLVPLDAETKGLLFTRASDKLDGKTWPKLSWRGWPGSAIGANLTVVGPQTIDYWFDPVRKLIGWREDGRVLTMTRVTLFDPQALLIRADFSVNPPDGFTEKEFGS